MTLIEAHQRARGSRPDEGRADGEARARADAGRSSSTTASGSRRCARRSTRSSTRRRSSSPARCGVALRPAPAVVDRAGARSTRSTRRRSPSYAHRRDVPARGGGGLHPARRRSRRELAAARRAQARRGMTLWGGRVGGGLAPEVWEFLRAEDAELLPYDCEATLRPRAAARTRPGCSPPTELAEVEAACGGSPSGTRSDEDEDVHSAIERLLGAGRAQDPRRPVAERPGRGRVPALRPRRVRRGGRGDRRARARGARPAPRPRRRRRCPATRTCSARSRSRSATTCSRGSRCSSATARGSRFARAARRRRRRSARARSRARRCRSRRRPAACATRSTRSPTATSRSTTSTPCAVLFVAPLADRRGARASGRRREFGFARLPESAATGSSMMPQKLNPDVAELVARQGRHGDRPAGRAARDGEGPAARVRPRPAGGQAAGLRRARATSRWRSPRSRCWSRGLEFDRERLAAAARRPAAARDRRGRGARPRGDAVPRRARAGRGAVREGTFDGRGGRDRGRRRARAASARRSPRRESPRCSTLPGQRAIEGGELALGGRAHRRSPTSRDAARRPDEATLRARARAYRDAAPGRARPVQRQGVPEPRDAAAASPRRGSARTSRRSASSSSRMRAGSTGPDRRPRQQQVATRRSRGARPRRAPRRARLRWTTSSARRRGRAARARARHAGHRRRHARRDPDRPPGSKFGLPPEQALEAIAPRARAGSTWRACTCTSARSCSTRGPRA